MGGRQRSVNIEGEASGAGAIHDEEIFKIPPPGPEVVLFSIDEFVTTKVVASLPVPAHKP